jgi:4-carboxymuconolactone decarboxylase
MSTGDEIANNEPRLGPTTDDDWDDETRQLLDALGHPNIFDTLAHHPKLLKRWLVFGNHVLAKSTLPTRERELAILRTGWRCGSEYEFGQHTVIGAEVGIADDEIRRLMTDGTDGWSTADAALDEGAPGWPA